MPDTSSISDWRIVEAVQPVSKYTHIEDYLKDMNRKNDPIQVRIIRIPYNRATMPEREAVAELVGRDYIGRKYPLSVARLWVYRFVNKLPWKIHGEWCTRIPWEAWEKLCPGVLARIPDGYQKKNPTPRTFENRLMAGNVMDVTAGIVYGRPGCWEFHAAGILPGDIICVRGYHGYAEIIRVILGSYTNHNGVFVRAPTGAGEASSPSRGRVRAINSDRPTSGILSVA